MSDFKPKRTRYESVSYGLIKQLLIHIVTKSTPRFTKSAKFSVNEASFD